MRVEQKSIVTLSSAPWNERSRWLERVVVELGKLALSRQLSITPECLLLMAQDLEDVPLGCLVAAITGWRRGTLRMGRPEQMDRFPTARQVRVQAELLRLEGWVSEERSERGMSPFLLGFGMRRICSLPHLTARREIWGTHLFCQDCCGRRCEKEDN